MIVELDGLTFETIEGTWSTEYIGRPNGLYDSDRVNYRIKFKGVDLSNPKNRTTSERHLRLVTFHSQTIHSDYEEKLKNALHLWIDSIEIGFNSTEEIEAAYVYPSITLQSLVVK